MKNLMGGAAAAALLSGTAFAGGHLPIEPGSGDYDWSGYEEFAANTDLSGQSLSITGPWTGDEKAKFDAVVALFAEATGAEAEYSGSDSFEQDIVIAAEAGSAPNLAVFPQPGLAADMAARGQLSPLPEGTADFVAENFAAGQSWVDLGTYANASGEDDLYGMFYRVDLKSLVWYVPEAFEENDYEIPETMEELIALSDQIVEDGGTPWCIGLGSGAATGWPATDWVEDMMLRTSPPEVYDQWVSNELSFDAPEVIAAIEAYGEFARNEEYVAGGGETAASTDFRDSPNGLFEVPPACYMHRQASFIPAFFPEGTEVGTDVDFFYFPAFEGQDLGQPVLGAGTLFSITNPSDTANAFIEFLKLPIAHEAWMTQGGFLTAHGGVNPELYADDALRGQAEIIQNATTFRFDGSDLMPGEIGAGAFWTGMVDYTTGASAEDVAAAIQERWDALK